MKKCTIGLFSKIITFLVFAVFFIPLTGICFYIAFLYPQASQEERLLFLAGVPMFGGLIAFAIYRTFYLGLVWMEYDMENVIFHYSRKGRISVPVGGNTVKPIQVPQRQSRKETAWSVRTARERGCILKNSHC